MAPQPYYHVLISKMSCLEKQPLFRSLLILLCKHGPPVMLLCFDQKNGAAWKNSPCFYSMSDPLWMRLVLMIRGRNEDHLERWSLTYPKSNWTYEKVLYQEGFPSLVFKKRGPSGKTVPRIFRINRSINNLSAPVGLTYGFIYKQHAGIYLHIGDCYNRDRLEKRSGPPFSVIFALQYSLTKT